jgi:hypothetical protein
MRQTAGMVDMGVSDFFSLEFGWLTPDNIPEIALDLPGVFGHTCINER